MICYRFLPLSGGAAFVQEVDPRRIPATEATGPVPAWTELSFHRCANCPLDPASVRHCPTALDLAPVVEAFLGKASIDKYRVEVDTPERSYAKECDLQTGLQSLMGLVMATSGCPILSKFRGPALFHLPFATLEETVLRISGFYLVKQYFKHRRGQAPDLALKQLSEIYASVTTVNDGFYKRVAAISEKDCHRNAIVNWECTSTLMASLEALLDGFEPLFVGGNNA